MGLDDAEPIDTKLFRIVSWLSVSLAELRRRAAAYLRRERREHTLQPTALVHEAYLRLVDQRRAVWQNRAQFFAVASKMMRRLLVDRARARRMAKRSGRWSRVALVESERVVQPVDVDVLALDAALTALAAFDSRKCQIAELRLFGGLTLEETAQAAVTLLPSSSTRRTACCLNSSLNRRRGRRLLVSAIGDIVSAFRKMSTKADQVHVRSCLRPGVEPATRRPN